MSTSPREPPRAPGSQVSQTLRFIRDPFPLIEEAWRACGDVFSVRIFGMGEWVFLCSPETVRQMFRASKEQLAAGAVNREALGFMLGTDATFSLDGEAHTRRQRIVFPLLNGKAVARHTERMVRATREAVESWPRGRPFPLLAETHRLSLDILLRAMFGDADPRRKELLEVFDRFADRGLRSPLMVMPYLQRGLGAWSPWGRILRLRHAVAEAFGAALAERRAVSDGAEVVDALLAGAETAGCPFSDRSLLDETINLLFAGHETTGAVLVWAVERLLSCPDVRSRVLEELSEVSGGGPIEPEDLPRLVYLDAVVQEIVRHRPIAPMAGLRKVMAPWDVGGYRIPEGRIVAQCFYAMTRRQELFPEPERFDPERFLDHRPAQYAWNPFGGGGRQCTGRGFALVELKVVLATLLQSCRLRLGRPVQKIARRGFFLAPADGLQVILEEARQDREDRPSRGFG